MDGLLDKLRASGVLTDEWVDAFRAVPRQDFLPDTLWELGAESNMFHPVRRAEQPVRWMTLATGETPVITQVDDGFPVGPGDVGDMSTSSSSMPYMVALMLKHLEIHGDERVLEIGTGTGWNAALLAYRVGADNVVSVEIDFELALHARQALAKWQPGSVFGSVKVITANGSNGYQPGQPYDRVISTAACHTVPYAWVQQARPGAIIVTPWSPEYLNFGLLTLRVQENGTATGRIVDTASFMPLRDQRRAAHLVAPSDEEEQQATVTKTSLHPSDVIHTGRSRGAIIAIGTRVSGCRARYQPPIDDPDGEGVLFLSDHTTKSWARLHALPESDGPYKVVQGGERMLWDEVEAAYQWWVELGSPGPDDWIFTVTSLGQRIEPM